MRSWWRGLAALLPMAASAQAAEVERIGPFDVEAKQSGYLAGWNEGRLRRETTTYHQVRHRGRRVALPTSGSGSAWHDVMNRVISFPASEPALLVNVGDPNNDSVFYLLRDADGVLRSEPIAAISGGGLQVAALDVADENLARNAMQTTRRLRFERASLLAVGDYTVFDGRTLQAYPLNRVQERSAYLALPLGAAPDRGSFVRLGAADDAGRYHLQEVDFLEDRIRYHPIDRARMRFARPPLIDAAWLVHHFRWQPDAHGRMRLTARDDVVPIPYRSERRDADADRLPSYEWSPVTTDFFLWAASRLEQAFAAAAEPFDESAQRVALAGGSDYFRRDWRVDGAEVSLSLGKSEGRYVALSAPWGSKLDAAQLERMAGAIDAALATGQFDELFDGGTER